MHISFTDRYFWKTKSAFARVKLAIKSFLRVIFADFNSIFQKVVIYSLNLLNISSVFNRFAKKTCYLTDNSLYSNKINLPTNSLRIEAEKPIIFASACVDETATGGWKYNGGIKELNYLVKLLRNHGHEAFMVTYDGKYEPWLTEHQPHISIQEYRALSSKNANIRCVTSWATAHSFIDDCKALYFWDMELAYTDGIHFSTLTKLYKNKIRRTASISRSIQAWHMCNFGKPCTIIPNICDESIWYPDESKRQYNRVGYMNEGEHTENYLNYLLDVAQTNGLNLQFQLIEGNESDVLFLMQSCNIFLGMNQGKSFLWGEGCPRTIIESQSAGCVPIAFDIIGNREIILSGFNGIIVPRYRLDLMAFALLDVYKDNEIIKTLRANTATLLKSCHTMECRWPAVQNFLEL